MATRKKPRTAAQKRATKKLVAFNKARGRLNKKRAAPKRPKRKPARKTVRRKSTTKRGWVIRARVIKNGIHLLYWSGKGFSTAKTDAKKYTSKSGAEKSARSMLGRLPEIIHSLEIVGL